MTRRIGAGGRELRENVTGERKRMQLANARQTTANTKSLSRMPPSLESHAFGDAVELRRAVGLLVAAAGDGLEHDATLLAHRQSARDTGRHPQVGTLRPRADGHALLVPLGFGPVPHGHPGLGWALVVLGKADAGNGRDAGGAAVLRGLEPDA